MKISKKQFAHLTDIEEEYIALPCDKTWDDVTKYQDEIGWPWKATKEQIEYWDAINREPIGDYYDFFPRGYPK
jgi:hypothetical protein